MAGKLIPEKSAAVTAAASTGYVTVASTTGFYAGAKGSLSKTAVPSVMIEITEVASATSLGVRILPENWHGITGGVGNAGPRYGRSDVSAYNGGSATIVQFGQLLFNPNDKPLD